MLINKSSRIVDKKMFEYVVEDYNTVMAKFKSLNVREMPLKQACELFNGYNFTSGMLFDFDSTWFIGTVMQMDGYLELSSSVEVYDFEGYFMNQYDINELRKII